MSKPFIMAFTGHRIQSLTHKQREAIPVKIREVLGKVKKVHGKYLGVISGMALGVDMYAARAAQTMGIRWAAYVPFPGQESRWYEADKRDYRKLLKCAAKVVMVSKSRPKNKREAVGMLMERNRAMVEDCHLLGAFWNGTRKGGAFETMKIASDIGRIGMIYRMDDDGNFKVMYSEDQREFEANQPFHMPMEGSLENEH